MGRAEPGRAAGNSLSPLHKGRWGRGWGSSGPHPQAVGQGPLSQPAPSLPDPNHTRAAGFQESVSLMGPPKSGWQQLVAPTAPLSSWGAGRPEPRGHPHGSCHGERAAQVPRDTATHSTLHHDEQRQDASSPWRWHQGASSPSPGIGAQLRPCPLARGSGSVAAVEQERKAELRSPSPLGIPRSPGGSCRAQDRASVCGTPGKAGPAARQVPALGTRMLAAIPSQSHQSVHAPALVGQDRPPSHQPHVARPARPCPLAWLALTSGSRCILCPAQAAVGVAPAGACKYHGC